MLLALFLLSCIHNMYIHNTLHMYSTYMHTLYKQYEWCYTAVMTLITYSVHSTDPPNPPTENPDNGNTPGEWMSIRECMCIYSDVECTRVCACVFVCICVCRCAHVCIHMCMYEPYTCINKLHT